jgi:sec-independent protein translocase protein TatA
MNCLATSLDGQMFYSIMNVIASFMNLAGPDLIVILLIILVLFGAKKLPELARGMGQAVKEFQKAKDEFSDELHNAGKTDVAASNPEVRSPQATIPRIEGAPPTDLRSDADRARVARDSNPPV